MSELKENVLSEVPTEKQASQTDLAVLSDPIQTDLEANQSDEADNYNFANQKFANIRSDVHIVSLDRRSTVQTEADTEMKYLLDLLASLRSRHILTVNWKALKVLKPVIPVQSFAMAVSRCLSHPLR